MKAEELSIEKLELAELIIIDENNVCETMACDDCVFDASDCVESQQELFAQLIKAEIKQRRVKKNRKRFFLILELKGLDKLKEAVKEFEKQQKKTCTYKSKVTTGSAVTETVVKGLSFKEVKILANGVNNGNC